MQNSFADFIKHTTSQKEVSLVIAKDDQEFEDFVGELEAKEYRQAVDVADLFKQIVQPSKVFFTIKNSLPKNIYDFIAQYSTGQIEIYDTFNKKSRIVVPVYKDTSVIFLITKDVLKKARESGFEILDQVGITYQS